MKTIKTILAAVVVLITSCQKEASGLKSNSSAAISNSVQQERETGTSTYTEYVTTCSGEVIEMASTLHFTIGSVYKDGIYHYSVAANEKSSGVSLTTGIKYVGNLVSILNGFEDVTVNDPTVQSQIFNYKLISQGGTENFYLKQTFIIKLNADGTLQSVHVSSESDCK